MLIIFFFFLILIFFVVITLAVRYRKRRRENEEMRVRFSEQLLASKVEIQEQTLQHVSRELHDNLGQVASLIKINLNTVQLKNPEAAEEKLSNTKELVKQLILDLKQLSVSLSTDKINKIGLVQALKLEEQKLIKTGLFTTNLTYPENMPILDAEREIIIYRMIQEILNNTIKHSEANNISLSIQYVGNMLDLLVSDDGKGFDVDKKLAETNEMGNGLLNLQSRAKVIKASYSIESAIGKGTTSKISIAV
jgi:signal transduction histidine kinase